ncbi:MAG TPA: hypothetical protein VFX30_04070 [bacterium]|nr:hypothetical protein [bacterium]
MKRRILRKPYWKILTGNEAVARAAAVLTDAGDRLSSVVRVEEAIGLIPALRKALEEGRPAALHIVYDHASDLSPFLALGLPVLISGSSQEAADLGAIALIAARAASTPLLHAYDRRWVGEELAKSDVLSEEELKHLDQITPRGGKEAFSDRLAALFQRFEALTGRALRLCRFTGPADAARVCVTAGAEAENLRDEKTALVSLKLVRPLPARAFLEALPSTTRELMTSELLRADVLSALHEGIVGGWSWFVNLPPLLALPPLASGDGPADVWKAVLRARDPEALAEMEAAVRGWLEDLGPRSSSYYQAHTMAEASGGSIHLRIAPHPIGERRPLSSSDLQITWEGTILTVSPAGQTPRSIDLDAIGRETGLGKRVGPVITACLSASIDAEKQLGLARERAEEIVREAVEDRWGDFSEDIVAAHRRAMDRTRQALADAETVIPLRPLERKAALGGEAARPSQARADLRTRYLGFSLRTPLIACVPAEASESERRAVAESPAGAVFFGPVSEEDLDREAWRTFETLHQGVRGPNQKTRPPLERYAELLKEWKEAVEVPVIAGIAASTEKNWLALAFALEQAGADALEIVLRSREEGGPADPLRVISLVAAAVRVPVAVRITPELAPLTERLEDAAGAGAKALVLFHPPNAFLKHPDTLEERRENLLAGPEVFRLALPKLARISSVTPPLDLGAAGPVSATGDLLRALLAGSHAVYIASDPDTASRLETSLKDWMGAKGFAYLPLSDGEVRRSVVE